MGGAFVNYFNRFGRQWQVYVQAEGLPDQGREPGQILCAEYQGDAVPMSSLTTVQDTFGPEFTHAV